MVIKIDTLYEERRGRSMKVIYWIACKDNLNEENKEETDEEMDEEKDEEGTDDLSFLGFAQVRIKFQKQVQEGALKVFISSMKEHSKKDFMVKINVTSKDLKFSKQLDCPDFWAGYTYMGVLKPGDNETEYVMDVSFVVAQAVHKPATLQCEMLYDDKTFTDFHLSTEEGSVMVHRACLAAHSDVFKTMLSGEWKEMTNGCMHIKGLHISLQTLKDLKTYMYLGTLPKEGLRPLLLIADCYKIGHLREECIWQLASTATADNLLDLLEFASDKKLIDLTFAILQVTSDSVVNSIYCEELGKEKQADEKEIEVK